MSKMAKTQQQLADAVGRSRGSIRQWLVDCRWPFSRTAPWDVAKVKAWARENLVEFEPEKQTGRLSPERQLKHKLTLEKLAAVKEHNEQRRKKFHSNEECLANRALQAKEIREALLRVEEAASAELEFNDDQRAILRGHLLGIVADFANKSPLPDAKKH